MYYSNAEITCVNVTESLLQWSKRATYLLQLKNCNWGSPRILPQKRKWIRKRIIQRLTKKKILPVLQPDSSKKTNKPFANFVCPLFLVKTGKRKEKAWNRNMNVFILKRLFSLYPTWFIHFFPLLYKTWKDRFLFLLTGCLFVSKDSIPASSPSS